MSELNTVTIERSYYDKLRAFDIAFEHKCQIGKIYIGYCSSARIEYFAFSDNDVVKNIKDEIESMREKHQLLINEIDKLRIIQKKTSWFKKIFSK